MEKHRKRKMKLKQKFKFGNITEGDIQQCMSNAMIDDRTQGYYV